MKSAAEQQRLLQEIAKYAGEINRFQQQQASGENGRTSGPHRRPPLNGRPIQYAPYQPHIKPFTKQFRPPQPIASTSATQTSMNIAGQEYIKHGQTLVLKDFLAKEAATKAEPKPAILAAKHPKQKRKTYDAWQANIMTLRKRFQNKVLDMTKLREKFTKKNSLQATRLDCLFYNKTGQCGFDKCHFQHLPERVSICPDFLCGKCTKPSAPETIALTSGTKFLQKVPETYCPLSHYMTSYKMPICQRFLKGECTKTPFFSAREQTPHSLFGHQITGSEPWCPYIHVKKGNTGICKLFSKGFYCPDGPFDCASKHYLACSGTADTCPRGENCNLIHFQPPSIVAAPAIDNGSSSSSSLTMKYLGQKRVWNVEKPEFTSVDVETGQVIPLYTSSDDEESESSTE